MDTERKSPPTRVVVCGGGVIGACTAYYLSKKGAFVTLIEKSSIACAASGKAAGFLALDWLDEGPLSSLARASFNLHRTLAQDLNGSEIYAYRSLTTLSLSVTESSLAAASSLGPTIPSWVNGPVNSPKTIGTPETTAQVHPQLFTKTLVKKAVEEYGVQVVIGKVEEVVVVAAEGRVRAVVLEGGKKIEADAVVLALGPWSNDLSLLSSLFRVYGQKVHSIVLEPNEPNTITPHALVLSYYPAQGCKPINPEIHPRSTGEVYVVGMFTEADIPDDPEQIKPVPESISVLKNVAATVSSHLREGAARVKAEQACFLPCTDDGMPVIGEVPGVKGCFVATGHGGWGIHNGPATGVAMAELVLDGEAKIVDVSSFSPSRFVLASKE